METKLESTEYVYRFRSARRLLEQSEELEKQSLYFASPEQQNDPMEGLLDLIWRGDAILWRNLFIHYFRCLYLAMAQVTVGGADQAIEVPVFASSFSFPIMENSIPFRQAKAAFLANCDLRGCSRLLGRRTRATGEYETTWLLSQVHVYALRAMLSVLIKQGAWNGPADMSRVPVSLVKLLRQQAIIESSRATTTEQSETFYRLSLQNLSQIEFIHAYNGTVDASQKGKGQVLIQFPRMYIKAIGRLVHSASYSVSLSKNVGNVAVWSHYADSHKGAVLIFNTQHDDDGRRFLDLQGRVGSSGDSAGVRPLIGNTCAEIYDVHYKDTRPSINFFDTLGTLPLRVLQKDWFSEGARRSISRAEILKDSDDWRKTYWSNLVRIATIKTADWAYEQEARLVKFGLLGELEDSDRIYTYKFSSLAGVIFGMRMSEEDKYALAKIIETKCRSERRSDFRFYQAFFDPASQTMKCDELTYLRWSEQKEKT